MYEGKLKNRQTLRLKPEVEIKTETEVEAVIELRLKHNESPRCCYETSGSWGSCGSRCA